MPLADQGTWVPWLIARSELLARKRAGVSWARAGAFPVPALTAVQVLDEALQIKAGANLLVNGAGGVSGGLIVSLAALRGTCVLATAGSSRSREVIRAGAAAVVGYHDPSDWPQEILVATDGRGVDTAANAARGGAATTMRAVRGGGRLATITSDPPEPERGIDACSVYVRPDAGQLELAAQELGSRTLELNLGARFPVAEAEAALARARAGTGGAVALEL